MSLVSLGGAEELTFEILGVSQQGRLGRNDLSVSA